MQKPPNLSPVHFALKFVNLEYCLKFTVKISHRIKRNNNEIAKHKVKIWTWEEKGPISKFIVLRYQDSSTTSNLQDDQFQVSEVGKSD